MGLLDYTALGSKSPMTFTARKTLGYLDQSAPNREFPGLDEKTIAMANARSDRALKPEDQSARDATIDQSAALKQSQADAQRQAMGLGGDQAMSEAIANRAQKHYMSDVNTKQRLDQEEAPTREVNRLSGAMGTNNQVNNVMLDQLSRMKQQRDMTQQLKNQALAGVLGLAGSGAGMAAGKMQSSNVQPQYSPMEYQQAGSPAQSANGGKASAL